MSAVLTPATQSFDTWWRAQSKIGDPSRRPQLTRDAFYAGWQAALEAHPARDERRPALHGEATIRGREALDGMLVLDIPKASQ